MQCKELHQAPYGCNIPAFASNLFILRGKGYEEVVWYGQKDYKKLLDIYDTYKEEYELPFPGFPKEYLLLLILRASAVS